MVSGGRWVWVVLGLALPFLGVAAIAQTSPGKKSAATPPAFLASRCGTCHSPTRRQGGLDLTSAAGIARGGEGGAVVEDGHPERSRILQAIETGKMPPRGFPRPTAAEVTALRGWIGRLTATATAAMPAVTQHQVVPLMNLRCTVCHGLRRQEGGLDLRTRASMVKGGKSGPALVPGKPEDSLVLKRIHAGDMPPPRLLVSVSVKPMEPAEIDLLTRWITAGAPEVEHSPDAPGRGPDPLVSDRDRQFWAFRPPRKVTAPAGPPGEHPIDAFLLQDLRRHGLGYSPEADRTTLIRRATFDLLGLPPTPEEVEAFLADQRPGAYERLIDRLLASPRYGERWARRWMDLAGYSDTEGIQDGDPLRPYNWRYRDYLIRAFNADKRFDRFLLEQLAGDELADYEHGPITSEIADNLTATGFLRQAVDATFAGITGFVPDRLEVIADEMSVLGSAVMGLTIKCARCHSHKFDPIPQRDYFRLTDIFKGALDEHDWLSPQLKDPTAKSLDGSRHLPHVSGEERRAWELRETELDAEAVAARKPVEERIQFLQSQGKKGTEPELAAGDPTLAAAIRERDRQLAGITARRRPAPVVRALWDRGAPSPTYLLQRGNYLRPDVAIGPGVPAVLTDGKNPLVVTPPWPGARQTGRRLAFARWLTRPDHPLTARVLVNRTWKQHFGKGIVTTLDNFGKTGTRPTHPDLLDWLARAFTREASGVPREIGLGWSLKQLHRLMVTSRAYRQSSRRVTRPASGSLEALAHKADPDNRLLWHFPLRRLEAEEVSDSILAVAGRLDLTPFGPPDELEIRADGLVRVKSTGRGWRRAVFSLQKRKAPITLLESFDLPPMGPNCLDRPVSTVATQALHLLNDQRVRDLAASFAERVIREAGPERAARIQRACRLALGRGPTPDEQRTAEASLDRLADEWRRQPGLTAEQAAERALSDYCLALLNSAAFLYVD